MQGSHGARTNQSVKAMKWLACRLHLLRHDSLFSFGEKPQTDRMRHANNDGELTEKRVLHFLVDGLHVQNHIFYEFHGCLWRGCPRCHPHHRDQQAKFHPDCTIQELHEATQQKHRLLRQHGHDLQIIWVCDWDREAKRNEDLKQILASYEMVQPLNPRDAFFFFFGGGGGGRTDAACLHHHGEQIKYVDVTSLSMGKQDTTVSHWSSHHHHQPGEPRHPCVLW